MSKTTLEAQNTQTAKQLLAHLLERPSAKQTPSKPLPLLELYDHSNLADCPWPQNADGQYAKAFLTPLIKQGVKAYIENVQTDLRVLVCDDVVLPVTINEAEYDNSYVCSPYSYYISYAKESLDHLVSGWLKNAFSGLLWGMAKLLKRCGVNKVVIVNNWMVSTNLYPQLEPKQIERIASFLQSKFPSHAIIFQSVDAQTNPVCYQTLNQVGFDYIASRQIYVLDPRQTSLFDSRLFKSDLKLLNQSGYEIIDAEQLTDQDIPRLIGFYRDLYVQKYSSLIPQFNENFLRLALLNQSLTFKALRKDGRIDGVIGYVTRNQMMFCPFFGYDRTLSKEISLYRLLSTMLMLEAYERQLVFHLSAGASASKKMRKAVGGIEYIAVYHQHLKMKNRLPWLALKKVCNSIGINYMEKY